MLHLPGFKPLFIWSLLLFNLLQAPSGNTGPKRVLLVGDSEHPPYSYLDQQQQKSGVYYDILQAFVTQNPDLNIELRLVPWARALHMVKTGQADGIFPPHYFPNRRPFLTHYSQPILKEVSSVFCNKQGQQKFEANASWPDNLKRASFVISNGVLMGGDKFWQMVDDKHIRATSVKGVENALRMVINNRADCHINDEFTILWQLNNLQQHAPDKLPVNVKNMVVIDQEAGYLATAEHLPPETSNRIISRFNQFLETLNKDNYLTNYLSDRVHTH